MDRYRSAPACGPIRGHIGSECEGLFVAAISRDQVSKPISARASAFRALDPQHVELADQVAEDDRTVAGIVSLSSRSYYGAGTTHRNHGRRSNASRPNKE
jgi:hypothetical protein